MNNGNESGLSWKDNLRYSLIYDHTGKSFIDWINKNGYLFTKESLVKELLVAYDMEIKKQLLKYQIEHAVHSKICEDLSDIRNKFIKYAIE